MRSFRAGFWKKKIKRIIGRLASQCHRLGTQAPGAHCPGDPADATPAGWRCGTLVRLFLFGKSRESQTPNSCIPILMGYEIKYPNCASGENGVKSESYFFLIKLLII